MNLSSKNKNLLLVLNPVSGKGRGKTILFDVVERFTKYGYRVTVLPTESGKKTENIIIKEAKNYDLAVAVGGDGTLNNTVSAIIKSGTDLPLGYIPLGSTNDFAASLGLPKDIDAACEKIVKGKPKAIDVGLFDDKYFVYIACTGMFSEASYTTPQPMKNAFGYSAYLWQGLISLKDTKKMRFEIEADGEKIEGDFLFCAVSNTIRAGGLVWLPKKEISFDDGLFELTLVKAPEKLKDGTALVNDLIVSRVDSGNFVRKKVKSAKIKTEHKSGWALDGENGGERNEATIEIVSKAIRFIY
ncbi:MAG: diacylglycerol kinase family lipid kinase [Clostridia bacterium]|nr:diacylglycerol kinase family lipid kinase [Clostridia bacterium]